jgi:hypothetical protein
MINNNNCVQPYVYGLLVLPSLLVALVACITAYAKGRSAASKSFLYVFIGSLVALLIIWFLINWLCKNNQQMIAWLVAILPLVIPIMYGFNFGTNTHYSWECHKKLRNTLNTFKCE